MWAAPSAPSSPTPSVASSSPHLAGRSEQFLTASPLHWTGGVLQHGGRGCRVVPRLVPPSSRHARAVCFHVPEGVGADHHNPHLPAGRGEQGGRCSSPAPPSVSIPNIAVEVYTYTLHHMSCSDMLRCPPMLALMLCDFANSWALTILVTEGPTFFSEALDFNIREVIFCQTTKETSYNCCCSRLAGSPLFPTWVGFWAPSCSVRCIVGCILGGCTTPAGVELATEAGPRACPHSAETQCSRHLPRTGRGARLAGAGYRQSLPGHRRHGRLLRLQRGHLRRA